MLIRGKFPRKFTEPSMLSEIRQSMSFSDYRDQVICHFDRCLAEPKSCPLHCGVIFGETSSVEDHFADFSNSHLNTTVEWMINSKKKIK